VADDDDEEVAKLSEADLAATAPKLLFFTWNGFFGLLLPARLVFKFFGVFTIETELDLRRGFTFLSSM